MRTEPPQGPVAHRIHAIVQQNPGIHFRELGRAASLTSTGQLRHHLDRLSRRGVVTEVADGRYRRYFPARYVPELQPQMARLSRPLPRRIARHLLAGPMTRTALRRALDCADSTLGYHLARLLRQGDLVQERSGNTAWYALAEPERVRRILEAQETAGADPVATRAVLLPYEPAFVPHAIEPLILPSQQEPPPALPPQSEPAPPAPVPPAWGEERQLPADLA